MRIHLLSDLHNEFSLFQPQVLDADVVILAGDIDLKGRGVHWAREVFSGQVLYVPGNHEYYGGHLKRTLVVITHHAPSLRSLADNPYAGGHMDAAYANRYDDLLEMGVDLWVHGHSHTACDYRTGTTRVVCNPRGYPGELTDWSPDLVLEL